MLAKLLTIGLPLAIPFALFGLFWWLRRRDEQKISIVPWSTLIAASLTLLVIGFLAYGLIDETFL